MKRSPLMAISIAIACLIVLASFTSVVGVQTVALSNNKLITDKIDQKELLFQTILDIANNKEIQKIISTSETRKGGLLNPSSNLAFTPPVLTKKFLNTAYHIGLILSKTISKSKMQSILERYQVNNREMQKEITATIEKDATLKEEIAQLSSLNCDCEKNSTRIWGFPVICTILLLMTAPLIVIEWISIIVFHAFMPVIEALLEIIFNIGGILCGWNL